MASAEEEPDDLPRVPIRLETLREAAGLLRYLRPYRVKFALGMACLFAGSLAGLGFPYLAGNLVDGALLRLGTGAVELPVAWYQDVDWVALALVAVLAVQAGFAFLRSTLFIEVGERSLCDLRRDTYARLIRLPMAFHTRRRVGELASRLSADLTRIRDALIEAVPEFLREGVLLVGGVALIATTSLRLTGLMLA